MPISGIPIDAKIADPNQYVYKRKRAYGLLRFEISIEERAWKGDISLPESLRYLVDPKALCPVAKTGAIRTGPYNAHICARPVRGNAEEAPETKRGLDSIQPCGRSARC